MSARVRAKAAKRSRAKPKPRSRSGEGAASRVEVANTVFDQLAAAYPDAHCALEHQDAFELLVATILSAQCTDVRVNLVTPALFARYPDAQALASAKPRDLERIIESTGFFRNKARNLIAMATALLAEHGGEVPRTIEALVALPGVGRKTANVVLGNAFGLDEGVVVDTHVARLSARLGWTTHTDPVKIELDLMQLFPRERWTLLSHLLIAHGRGDCSARSPKHDACAVAKHCPSSEAPVKLRRRTGRAR